MCCSGWFRLRGSSILRCLCWGRIRWKLFTAALGPSVSSFNGVYLSDQISQKPLVSRHAILFFSWQISRPGLFLSVTYWNAAVPFHDKDCFPFKGWRVFWFLFFSFLFIFSFFLLPKVCYKWTYFPQVKKKKVAFPLSTNMMGITFWLCGAWIQPDRQYGRIYLIMRQVSGACSNIVLLEEVHSWESQKRVRLPIMRLSC